MINKDFLVIDSFCFFNELDLLDLRFNELDPYVDYFILVEAGKTQSLLDKPFYFEQNRERYAKFLDKVIHVKVEDYPDNKGNLWKMENHQRNCILRGIQRIPNVKDRDIIMVSDMDEIPRGSKVGGFAPAIGTAGFMHLITLNCVFYAYFMNLKAKQKIWPGAVLTSVGAMKKLSPQEVKDGKNGYAKVVDGGWHFSWLGGAEKIWEKAHSCIEPYDKTQIPSREEYIKFFEDFVKLDRKFFVRTECLGLSDLEFVKTEIDGTYPKYVLDNLEKYRKYIL